MIAKLMAVLLLLIGATGVFWSGNNFGQDEDEHLTTKLSGNPELAAPTSFPDSKDPRELLEALCKSDKLLASRFGDTHPVRQLAADRRNDAQAMIELGKSLLEKSKSTANGKLQRSSDETSTSSPLSAKQAYVLGIAANELGQRADTILFFEAGIQANDSPRIVAEIRNHLAAIYGSNVAFRQMTLRPGDQINAENAIRIHRLAIADKSHENQLHREHHLMQLVRLLVALDRIDDAVEAAIVLSAAKPDASLCNDIIALPTFAIVLEKDSPMSKFVKQIQTVSGISDSMRKEAHQLLPHQ